MTYENILVSAEDGILTITINRESKMNALNIATLAEIRQAVETIQQDDSVKVIILTGAGTKAFAAGADISEFAEFSSAEGERMSADGHAVMNAIEYSPKPVIAAVNGFALGGGCELAMACHLRIASDNARFGQPEVNLGLIPGYGGTQRLFQIVGKGKGLEMILTGDPVKAEEAWSLGLVNHVVPQVELMNKCREIAKKMISKSPYAISRSIACVNMHYSDPGNGFTMEIKEFGECFSTSDFKEGTSAFLEKRPARFTGN